jgi:hypothetical protein
MQAKMDFCAHCIINILQNVSQKRENKRITWNDLKFAIVSGFSTIYPGKTMFCTKASTHVYGHCPIAFVVCVKGVGGGKASVLWAMMYSAQNSLSIDANNNTGLRDNHANSAIRCLKDVHPSQIYNGLEIKEKEMKILVECNIIYISDAANFFTDGRCCGNVSFREAMGFFILNPNAATKWKANSTHFSRVMIFTPKPGLFDETPVSTHVAT